MKQPLTAKQISKKTRINLDTCSYILGRFVSKGLSVCLNPEARSSRLYWLTDLGRSCRELNLPDDESFGLLIDIAKGGEVRGGRGLGESCLQRIDHAGSPCRTQNVPPNQPFASPERIALYPHAP